MLALGCAGFRRGEYWDDSSESSAAPDDDGDDGTPQTTGGEGSGGSGDGDTGASTGAPPEGPSFAADVLPLLDAGCERCHASDGAASHTSFLLDVDEQTAYETTLDFVDLDQPEDSPLLLKGAGLGHTGGAIYDEHSAEHATILEWIEQGAMP